MPADTTGYDVSGCNVGGHAWDTALTEAECSVTCANGYSASRTNDAKATCSTSGGTFALSGCYPVNDNATDAPAFVGTDNVGHWDTYYGLDVDGSGNVLSWTSRQDKDGNNHKLSTTGTGRVLTENSTLVGDRPVINWTSGNGHLENDTYAGLSGKTKFTRIIVAKADGTSSLKLLGGTELVVGMVILIITELIMFSLIILEVAMDK